MVYKLHSKLYLIKEPKDVILEKIKTAVYKAWEHITNKFLYNLIDSIKAQVKAMMNVIPVCLKGICRISSLLKILNYRRKKSKS